MYHPSAKFGDNTSSSFCFRVLTFTHIHTHAQLHTLIHMHRAAEHPTHAFNYVGASKDFWVIF